MGRKFVPRNSYSDDSIRPETPPVHDHLQDFGLSIPVTDAQRKLVDQRKAAAIKLVERNAIDDDDKADLLNKLGLDDAPPIPMREQQNRRKADEARRRRDRARRQEGSRP